MIQRLHRSMRASSRKTSLRSRSGFTLVELLVVMGVIAILMSLTAAGVMAWMNGQARNNTIAEVRGLQPILMQHWDAVIADAKKERVWTSDESSLISSADGDIERARILLIKIRLIEAFPVNYKELMPTSIPPTVPNGPWTGTPPTLTGSECYTSAPLSAIPANKRRYRAAYQTALWDSNATPPGPRWGTYPIPSGKESVESAVCLYVALNTARQGINVDTDQLIPWMKDVDGTGRVLADAWGVPLRFYRFATNNNATCRSTAIAPRPRRRDLDRSRSARRQRQADGRQDWTANPNGLPGWSGTNELQHHDPHAHVYPGRHHGSCRPDCRSIRNTGHRVGRPGRQVRPPRR